MPAHEREPARALSDAQIRQFIEDGFVRLDRAFPRELADQGRAILWRDLPCDPNDPATWTRPVIRLGYYGDEPFKRAVNSPVLHAAFDQLVGKGRWYPRADLGTFPVRFPSPDDPGDAGWHIDVSFPGVSSDPNERQDFSSWRANITSRGRALLMLFLFSDVGECDAPTRIKVGSHRDIARLSNRRARRERRTGRRMNWPRRWIGRRHWRQAKPAPSICAIPSCCMPRRCIVARCRASWRNRRCIRPSLSGSIGRTAAIRRWKSPFGRP